MIKKSFTYFKLTVKILFIAIVVINLFATAFDLVRGDTDSIKQRVNDNFIVKHVKKEQKLARFKRDVTLLNLMTPSFSGILKSRGKGLGEEHVKYYKKVAETMPQRAASHGMLGVFYYYQGEIDLAMASLKKALMLNPQFFGFYYNLGMIYFQQGQYDTAVSLFKKAASINPSIAIKFIRSSKVYLDIIKGSNNDNFSLAQEIMNGYRDTFLMLTRCFYHLMDFEQTADFASRGIALNPKAHKDFDLYAGVAAVELQKYDEAGKFFYKYFNDSKLLSDDVSFDGNRYMFDQQGIERDWLIKAQDTLQSSHAQIELRIF